MLTQTIKDLYQQRAPSYDLAVRVYQGAFGFRYSAYKKRTIELLRAKPGDTVVDLGCGTGLNFAPILADIGTSGKLIGVDLSQNMLARAAERITRSGWENVQLVESDMTAYQYPAPLQGVVSSGALGYVSDSNRVIETAFRALAAGGRMAIWDLKIPQGWPSWLLRLFFASIARPYGVTNEYVTARPWETLGHYFADATFEERYWGLVYIASGSAPQTPM